MEMKISIPTLCIIFGIMMIVGGVAYPLVTVMVDTKPPTLTGSNPSSGTIVVRIDSFTATFTDSDSGVKSVYFSLASLVTNQYLVSQQPMTLISGNMYSGTWKYTVSPVVTDSGKYIVYVQAGDYADNWVTYNVELQVYVQFQGKWYINDKEIASSNQTIYSKTNTVTFKFVKTAGIADSYITCTVWEGAAKQLTLTSTEANTWTGSYTLTAGKHTLQLKAYDGTKEIVMSVLDLGIGDIPQEFPFPLGINHLIIIVGVVLSAVGIVSRGKETMRR